MSEDHSQRGVVFVCLKLVEYVVVCDPWLCVIDSIWMCSVDHPLLPEQCFCSGYCLICCCGEWSGMSNCDVVFLYDVHGIGRCKSFARGGDHGLVCKFFLFGISGSSSRVSGGISGSCSEVFIQIPLTCIQSILFRFLTPHCTAEQGQDQFHELLFHAL